MTESRNEKSPHIVEYKTYVYVWIALMVLLGLTIFAARVEVSSYSVLVNLLIASIKTLLVLAFFMHLKYEGAFLRWFLTSVLLILSAVIMLTFADVWYR